MRTLLLGAALCGMMWFAPSARADGPAIQLLPTVSTAAPIPVMPVRVGYGWRGAGYYPGVARPYATYGYGGYAPYNVGYGGYYAPYGGYSYGAFYPRAGYYYGW